MDRNKSTDPHEPAPGEAQERSPLEAETQRNEEEANPPHTTTGPITAPKFGSAGSGGAELEPGPTKP